MDAYRLDRSYGNMLSNPALDLLSAYSVLFDSSVGFSEAFLKELQPTQLKTAFRKKALATHPDRSMALGLTEAELQIRFQKVSTAYEVLKPFVTRKKKKKQEYNTPADRRTGNKPPQKRPKDHYFNGTLPERRLKIGQFLYYSRLISWQTLIDAIVWQKKQRPLFGQIAKDWGYLTPSDIIRIIRHKKYHDRFGDYALRNGYLTPFQQMAIAGKQRICQPRIGGHFIRKGFVTESQMKVYRQKVFFHNMKFRELNNQFR